MNPTDKEVLETELESLKAKADLLGVAYHPSIGLEKLSAKIGAGQPLNARTLSLPRSEKSNWLLVASCLKYDRPQKKPEADPAERSYVELLDTAEKRI